MLFKIFLIERLEARRLREPFNDRKSQQMGEYVFGYNSPAAAAREVFKPSTDSSLASLVVPSQKKHFQFWVWGSLGGASQVGVLSRFYGLLYTVLDAHRMSSHFGPSIFTKLGYLTSF